jgi:predicted RNA-binding protein Jag
MKEAVSKIKILLERMDFPESQVEFDEENQRMAILILDHSQNPINFFPEELMAFEHILGLILRRHKDDGRFIIDINNRRREREKLIRELAKTAAHKASLIKGEVALPVMNAFERRLVHIELAGRPDLKTESTGEGRDRHIIIKPL